MPALSTLSNLLTCLLSIPVPTQATNSLSATAPPQHQTNDKTYVWYPQPEEEPSPQSSSSELPAVESSFRCKLKRAGEAASKPVKRTTAGIRARVARLTKKQNKSKRSAALRRTPTPAPEGFSMASRFQRDPVPSAAARTARSAPAAGETMFVRQPQAGRNNRWVNTARLNSKGVADDSASVRSFASASTSDVARIVSD